MKTKVININAVVNSMKSEYAKACKSLNYALRFCLDMAKEGKKDVPAAPAKDDKSEEAKALRAEIKNINNYNTVIDMAKEIVAAFSLTSESLKKKNIGDVRANIMACYPMQTKDGVCVTTAGLPEYIRSDYKGAYIVTPATWIEVLTRAAKNVSGDARKWYVITVAPVTVEGITTEAEGDIVDVNGDKVNNVDEILAKWTRLAPINSEANKVGKEAKSNYMAANIGL